ncbi:MAG: NAD-dependent deacylase [Hyphomicrobiaceae bacterium]|nr:NAD-dependent deacylase [Hyphomicrobiaceae bacterium]
MTAFERIVILTGAGLSAESGLATFRDKDGIWAKYDLSELATPEGFARNPARVHEFYNQRRRGLRSVAPNAAHQALARLERGHRGEVTIVTQNIDALHEAAGSTRLIHMHGELLKALCARCEARHPWHEDLSLDVACPACGRAGGMRPDVVWFGEWPYRMEEIQDLLRQADLFVSIGTSGTVYPAAGFVREARAAGARTLELNLEPSEGASLFAGAIHGPATRIVPAWVDALLEDAR